MDSKININPETERFYAEQISEVLEKLHHRFIDLDEAKEKVVDLTFGLVHEYVNEIGLLLYQILDETKKPEANNK